MAVITIAGAGLGVHLGRGAISEVNPVYFSTAASSRFFADLSATPYEPTAPDWTHPSDFWANDLNVGGRPACLDCPSNFVEAGPGDTGYSDYSSEARAYVAREAVVETPVAEQPPQVVTRYTNFPVSAEEAQEQAYATGDQYAVQQSEQSGSEETSGVVPRGM